MPTPFTHLETAQRLLADEQVPASTRTLLARHKPAFLLGNIAADARNNGNLTREATHFYNYDKPIFNHPWRVMLGQNPVLAQPATADQRAFVAGYVAHLSMDEIWSLNMLGPHFAEADWAPHNTRFLMLHVILIYMDERDYNSLESWQPETLAQTLPDHWLPFMSDETLTGWRDFIAGQIQPGGASQTLDVFGKRINKTPAELRAILDVPEAMQTQLWANIKPSLLDTVERDMYTHARQQMNTYWAETA
ncbi:MAG: zinc dependent phospholipase C family protein [Chloroflexi bacterium]|nr:zinc dependent phospholipase C family protein [Chloroflexota bacterium]